MKRRRATTPFLGFFALPFSLLLSVQASAAPIPHGTVDFVAEDQWMSPGRASYFALYFQLEKDWHTYWVNPGDSGQPLRADWHLPNGLAAGQIEWPAPRRLGTPSVTDFGYVTSATLLVPIRADASLQPAQQVELSANLSVLVCREICIPGKAHISLSIPIKSIPPESNSQTRELFAAARKFLPRTPPPDWTFRIIDTNDSFILTANLGREATRATFFPLDESQVDNSAPQKLQPLRAGFRLTLRKSDQLLKSIRMLKGVLELSAEDSYIIDAAVGSSAAGEKVE